MPATAPITSPNDRPASESVRITLIGHTGTGKTALLGALHWAAVTQEHLLHGTLNDPAQSLAELQKQLDDGNLESTSDDIVNYHVTFESANGVGSFSRTPTGVSLTDTSGVLGGKLLTSWESLDGSHDRNPLLLSIRGSDALVITVDGSAGPVHLENVFSQVDRFLRLLEQIRGRWTQVGGLPVFLVLTKCDLLAQSGDSLAAWTDRVEGRRRHAEQRFKDFLPGSRARGPITFGSVELHICATTTEQPRFGKEAQGRGEPYGVAELFRHAFDKAWAHGERQVKSTWRLFLTVIGALGLVALMGALAYVFFLVRLANQQELAGPVRTLQNEVEHRVLVQNQSPQARYRNVKSKVEKLEALRNNENFGKLPGKLQDAVIEELDTLKAYQEFESRMYALPDPAKAKFADEPALKDAQEELNKIGKLALDHPDWLGTDVGRRYAEIETETDALDSAVTYLKSRYLRLLADGNEVLERSAKPDLPKRAAAVLKEAKELESETQKDNPVLRARRVTYGTALEFPTVKELKKKWEDGTIKSRLEVPARLYKP